jgi:hypothetical protein
MSKIYSHKSYDALWLLQNYLSPNVYESIWTLNLMIMSQVFDHCAATSVQFFKNSKIYECIIK